MTPDPILYNSDLAPTPDAERTWTRWHLAALWVGMSVCVPTYMLAASLVKSGMNWWQAMLAILLGNLLVLVPMILCGHAGTRYGVPFPVFARASFGVFGAHVPSLARALVACGWFGIQTYIGGEAISAMIGILWPDWLTLGGGGTFVGLTLPSWISFFGFWLVNVVFVWRGTESIKWLENFAAPFLIVVGLALLGWAVSAAGGLGTILAHSASLVQESGYTGGPWMLYVFLPGVTAMVGFWATLSLNIPDFTRYCKNQREQLLGQLYGLPTTMLLFSFIGVAVTSATVLLYGEAIWNPVDLVVRLSKATGSPLLAFLAMFTLAIATLSTNIAANVVSPANDFSNLAPSRISFRAGGMITAFIGIFMMPWKLVADPGGYIFTWLIGYGALLGPIAGIMIADYYVLRRKHLELRHLYQADGIYTYTAGFSLAALGAFALAVLPNLPGFLAQTGAIAGTHPLFTALYQQAWFVGFGLAFALYLGFRKIAPVATHT